MSRLINSPVLIQTLLTYGSLSVRACLGFTVMQPLIE